MAAGPAPSEATDHSSGRCGSPAPPAIGRPSSTRSIGLGQIHRDQGRYEQATEHYQQALRLARATGHRPGELQALNGLGHLQRHTGPVRAGHRHSNRRCGWPAPLTTTPASRARWQASARSTCTGPVRAGRRRLPTAARPRPGERRPQLAVRSTAGPGPATARHRPPGRRPHPPPPALALANELGQPDDEARAHDGLAHAHHAMRRPEQARTHWQHALDILTDLGNVRTDEADTTVATIHARLVGRSGLLRATGASRSV